MSNKTIRKKQAISLGDDAVERMCDGTILRLGDSKWHFSQDGYIVFHHSRETYQYSVTPDQQQKLYEYLLFSETATEREQNQGK